LAEVNPKVHDEHDKAERIVWRCGKSAVFCLANNRDDFAGFQKGLSKNLLKKD